MSEASIWEVIAAAPWVAGLVYLGLRRRDRWVASASALAFAWIMLVVAMRETEIGPTSLVADGLVPGLAVGAFVFLLFASWSIPQLGRFPILALGAFGVAYLLAVAANAIVPALDGSGVEAERVGPNLVCESSRWIAMFNHTGTLVVLNRTLPPFGLLKTRVAAISQDDGDTQVASCAAVLDLYRRGRVARH